MRFGTRPFLTALRTLLAAAGLLLLLMIGLQFFPRWRSVLGLAAAQQEAVPAKPRAELPEDSDDLWDAESLSGSVAGKSPLRDTDEISTATIEMPVAANDETPSPPFPAESVRPRQTSAESKQVRHCLSELERFSHLLTSQQAECLKVRGQMESQELELKSALIRLNGAEQQVRTLQVALETERKRREAEVKPESDPPRISIRSTTELGQSRLVIEARDASLPELLARLGEASGMNLLVAPDVGGTASLHLNLPDSEAALEAVCRIHQCRTERNGNFIVVCRHDALTSLEEPKPQLPETMTKLYRLKHLSASEMRPYVQPLLTPGVGTVSFATIRERVARTEYREPPRAILVKDTPSVLADVDRLILELDRPPTHGKALPGSSRQASATQPKAAQPLPQALAQPPQALPPATALPAPLPLPLPTGPELPGPCLDSERFEPPVEIAPPARR